jgi:hypothetical protein
MAAVLDVRWVAELIIERNLPLVTPNKPQKNWMNWPRRLSSNQRKPNPKWWPFSGHLGWAAELIIERNLFLVTPNEPQKNWINRPRRSSSNRRKRNPTWPPSWMSGGADHRKEPSSSHPPNEPHKNRINRPRHLTWNRRKPKSKVAAVLLKKLTTLTQIYGADTQG